MNILNSVLNNTTVNCYNSGLSVTENSPKVVIEDTAPDKFEKSVKKKTDKKVLAGSIIGSLSGILASVGAVYALAKTKNPSLAFKNLRYEELDVLMVGAGSVLGGLVGGLISDKDKNNVKPKLREASQQFLGNMACPIGLMAATTRLLDKSGFKLPQINSSSRPAQAVNVALRALPKVVVTIASLVGGMEIGNKIMNKVNNIVFKEEVKHDVHAEDYLVHADDLCLAANCLLKDAGSITKVTSKILPFTFIVAGSKTGIQKSEQEHN